MASTEAKAAAAATHAAAKEAKILACSEAKAAEKATKAGKKQKRSSAKTNADAKAKKTATIADLRAAAAAALADGSLRADILLADDPGRMFEAWLAANSGLALKKSHRKEITEQRDVLLYDLDAMLIGRLHQFIRDY